MSVLHSSEPEDASSLHADEGASPAGQPPPGGRDLAFVVPARWRQPAVGYAAAVMLQALALLLAWFLGQVNPAVGYLSTLPLLVVAFVALTWGVGPSLLALLLGTALNIYNLLPVDFTDASDQGYLIRIVAFLLAGLVISRLASQNQRARSAAEMLADSLERERARLQATFESIPDPVTFYDAEGTLIDANPVGARSIGNRPLPARLETLPGSHHIRTLQGESLPVDHLPVARALRGETVNGVEVLTSGPDGSDRVLLTSAAPIRNRQGKIEGAVATSHDITALRQAEQDAAQQRRQLQALLALTDTALTHLSLDELLGELLSRLREVIGVNNAAILLLDEQKQLLHMRVAHGLEEEIADRVHIPVGVGFAGRIAASRQPLIVEDLSTFDAFNPFLREHLRSVVGVPLMIGERVLGVAHVGAASPRHFTEEEVQLLQRAADRIALAVDRAALFEAAQKARTEAEQRAGELEAVVESITDGVFIYGPQGETRSINTAARVMMGFEAQPGVDTLTVQDRVPLLTAYDEQGNLLPAERFPAFRVIHGEMLTSASSVDMRLHTMDGREVQLNCTGAPIRDAGGRQVGAVLVARDVTERRRLEREVAERAQEFEAIFESMTDGVFVFDAQGGIRRANAFARHILGPEESNWQGRSMEERFTYLLPHDKDLQVVPFERLPAQRLLRGEVLTGAQAVDLIYPRPDGGTLVANMSGTPLRDQAGAITGAVLMAHDVTERRRLELRTQEALQALLDMAQALVLEPAEEAPAEQDGAALRVVARRLAELARKVVGAERTSFYSFDRETELFHPLAVVGLPPEQEQQWLANPGRGHRLAENLKPELSERFLAGEVIVVDMRQPELSAFSNPYAIQTLLAAPLYVGQRLVGQFVLDFGPVAHDYTPQEIALAEAVSKLAALVIDRDRLLREREEARASVLALEEANRRMDEFLGIASHELRTPLTKIKISMQLAEHRVRTTVRQDSAADGQLAKILQPIQVMMGRAARSVDMVNRLVGDLLDVSRIQSDRLKMHLAPVDLTQVVREMVEEQRELFPKRVITLTLPDDGSIWVSADAERVGQVVINYLTNALKYSPETRPVEVGAQVDERVARVWVRDHGQGIPPEAGARLWERFYQAPGVAVQQGSSVGLGLGLYISKTIIEQHGGQIGVESVPGEGATFWFTLPLAG